MSANATLFARGRGTGRGLELEPEETRGAGRGSEWSTGLWTGAWNHHSRKPSAAGWLRQSGSGSMLLQAAAVSTSLSPVCDIRVDDQRRGKRRIEPAGGCLIHKCQVGQERSRCNPSAGGMRSAAGRGFIQTENEQRRQVRQPITLFDVIHSVSFDCQPGNPSRPASNSGSPAGPRRSCRCMACARSACP